MWICMKSDSHTQRNLMSDNIVPASPEEFIENEQKGIPQISRDFVLHLQHDAKYDLLEIA